MNEKKIEEKQILEKIYNNKNENLYKVIDSVSEKPDFILKDLISDELFGVEITNMFYNEFSARLQIPENVNMMLKNGIPRKAEGVLARHKIYINIENSWHYIGDTIGQSFKDYDDYINAIINTINVKTVKAKKYKKLDYIELFIYDNENYLRFKKIEDLKYLEGSEKLKNAISNSPFKRIYFFTIVNNYSMLLLNGDISSGPLAISDEKLEIHKNYMKNLFNKNT